MRTIKNVMIEKIIITYICDFCTFSTADNRGCCGYAPVMKCGVCGKDVCHNHRNVYSEDGTSDHYDIVVCSECDKTFSDAWEWALDNAGRNEDMADVACGRMKILVDAAVAYVNK